MGGKGRAIVPVPPKTEKQGYFSGEKNTEQDREKDGAKTTKNGQHGNLHREQRSGKEQLRVKKGKARKDRFTSKKNRMPTAPAPKRKGAKKRAWFTNMLGDKAVVQKKISLGGKNLPKRIG